MSQLEDPKWLQDAKSFLGTKEIPGPKHNATIAGFMKEFSGGAIYDDETAWCGGFAGFILQRNNLPIPDNPLGARNYLTVGMRLDRPAVGALAIWWRGSKSGWQGHVNFVAGKDKNGNVMCIGGNQNNEVNITPYDWKSANNRLLDWVWPSKSPLAERYNLPLIASTGKVIGGSEA